MVYLHLLWYSPVTYINVLDPNKHKKENQEKNYDVSDHQVILEEEGILKKTVVIKDESDTTYSSNIFIFTPPRSEY